MSLAIWVNLEDKKKSQDKKEGQNKIFVCKSVFYFL